MEHSQKNALTTWQVSLLTLVLGLDGNAPYSLIAITERLLPKETRNNKSVSSNNLYRKMRARFLVACEILLIVPTYNEFRKKLAVEFPDKSIADIVKQLKANAFPGKQKGQRYLPKRPNKTNDDICPPAPAISASHRPTYNGNRGGVKLQSCPRCKGSLAIETDLYGAYEDCVNCGYTRDIKEETNELH